MRKKQTDFVKKMNKLKALLQPKLLWISKHPKTGEGLTYVRKVHGELRHV